MFELSNFTNVDGSTVCKLQSDFWANQLSNAIQKNKIISKTR